MMTNDHIRSRQLNPCDHLYWKSRGYMCRPPNWREILDALEAERQRLEHIHKSNVKNPNNILFWKERGYSKRPDNWKELWYEMSSDYSE